jgi:glyoxylase-like metal-dependent hydrolase (beta-lactamase superfamily II)
VSGGHGALTNAVTIAPGIRQIDTLLGGMERLSAGFLIEGPMPALVETGSQSSVPAVLDALATVGLGPGDLRWIVVTHIHLDHAGAVGDLAAHFPSASVVVHERGARHIVDPTKLIDSASRVYGPLLDSLYGRMTAVPEDRVIAAGDGFRVDLGNHRELVLIDSPGHANHHHAVLDEATGTLLVGDAVGVLSPDLGVLRPATPPPDFDLERATQSLRRFADLRPERIVLTHYGPVIDPQATLAGAEAMLHAWVDVAAGVMDHTSVASVDDVAAALTEAFVVAPTTMPEASPTKFEILNGVHSNAAGIVRYLRRKATAPVE